VSAVTVTIAAEHPALAGHFPGAPILPGVLLLDEMLRAVEQERSCAGMRWRIGAAKFVKPVRPGETLTLEHEPLANGSIRFHIASAGQPVAHGVLVPAIAPEEPQRDVHAAAVPAGPRASAAQWAGAPERGSATLLRIMIFLSLRLGRPVARCLLHLIAAYFFAFAPGARRSSRQYLRRALGREPGARDRYRQVFEPKEGGLLFPAVLQGIKESSKRCRLGISDPKHPAFEVFRGVEGSSLEQVGFDRFFSLEPASGASVVARFDDPARTPAILDAAAGKGHVALFNMSADRDWNDWPADPSYPIVLQEWVR